MDRYDQYLLFKEFGTIYKIVMDIRPDRPYWTRIILLGKVDIDYELMHSMISHSHHNYDLLSVRQIKLFTPLIKLGPRQPLPSNSALSTSLSPESSAYFELNKFDDLCIYQILDKLPVLDLTAAANTSHRLNTIANAVFRNRYKCRPFLYEELTTNGVLTYPELEQVIRTFTQFIPAMFEMPEEYSTFSTGVICDILFHDPSEKF